MTDNVSRETFTGWSDSMGINQSYNWAVNTCNKDKVGYSQAYRNQQRVNGITYYDCSSFIWYALKSGGYKVVQANGGSSYPFTTSSMRPVLQALGFQQVPITAEWKPGDILWRQGHTEMVYNGRVTMGAHSSSYPLAQQVSINSNPSSPSSWSQCWRDGDGASGLSTSVYVAAAICGNWMAESTLNPGQWEAGPKQGFGLGQWTDNSESTRRTELLKWLSENGYESNDGDGQLAYFIHEGTWLKNPPANDFDNLEDFLTSDSTDISYLTEVFMKGWEGLLNGNLDDRIRYANGYYDYFIAHGNEDTQPWYSEENYDNPASTYMEYGSEANLNNALLIYKYLSVGLDENAQDQSKKGMPLWMYCRWTY